MSALTYNDVLSAYADYPAPIRPYLLRAETHPAIRPHLTKCGARVFIDLLARAPIADATRPIMVRVDAIADKLAVSCKTVSRVIRSMLEAGWLVRFDGHDGRDNAGKYSYRQFVVGLGLRQLLGLSTASSAARATSPVVRDATGDSESASRVESMRHPAQTGMGAADAAALPSPVLIEPEMSDGLIEVNKVFSKEASETEASLKKPISRTRGVPLDLLSLSTEIGITDHGIFGLMQLAKRVRQRLQDVWTVARDRILNAGAREGRAVCYLRHLLNTGEDFAYTARCLRAGSAVVDVTPPAAHAAAGTGSAREVESADPAMAAQARISRWKSSYAGRQFAGPDGVRIVIHEDGSGNFSDDERTNVFVSLRDMVEIYRAIERGLLSAVSTEVGEG